MRLGLTTPIPNAAGTVGHHTNFGSIVLPSTHTTKPIMTTTLLEMNNRAVSNMIQDRNYETAMKCLTRTLALIKCHMTTADIGTTSEVTIEDGSRESHSWHSEDPCVFVTEFSSHGDNAEILGIGCSSSMFGAPILLSTTQHPRNQDTETWELLSYVVMYNMALACHLKGMEEQENSSIRNRFLVSSATLYKQARTILEARSGFEVSILHEMAISSNLGHIYLTLGDEDQAKPYFEHLLSVILCVVDCGGDATIADTTLDGFFCNVTPLILSSCQSAAAA